MQQLDLEADWKVADFSMGKPGNPWEILTIDGGHSEFSHEKW
jgi:hypothetical protein